MNRKAFNNIAAFKTLNSVMDNSASQLITPPYKTDRVQRTPYIKILLFENQCCKNEALNLGRGKD